MGIHDGHRERLRKKFIAAGLRGFSDVNILELLLFFAVPRRDTNPTAHALLERFNSLEGVFSASLAELCSVKGVGESAAVLLRLVGDIRTRPSADDVDIKINLSRPREVERFIEPFFLGQSSEALLLICTDADMNVLSARILSTGSTASVEIDPAVIAREALLHRAHAVILAHNHIKGLPTPSYEDIASTKRLSEMLSTLNIRLADHIIFSEHGCVSVLAGFLV